MLGVALLVCGAALVHSVLSVWFTSEVIATPANTELAAPRLAERVLLIVVDGLRCDTALETGAMPRLIELSQRGSSGVSWAPHVTMTGLGVRTLGTGVSPSLADLLQNVRLPAVTFDNVFAALRRRGGHVAAIGNPSWQEAFGAELDIDLGASRLIELVSKANPVYPADAIIVARARALMARSGWELAVVHIVGLDNASHMWTPFAARFLEKARAVDRDVQRLVAAAGERTTVLITSDHGASDRGHHGSGEPIARRTPLVLLGPGIRPGIHFEAQQTDVAPTIALLLGLPLPAPSEGRPVLEALDLSADETTAAAAATARQQQRYADAFARAHALSPPQISPGQLHRLGEWLEETRNGASLMPLAWAALLGALAIALVLRGERDGQATSSWSGRAFGLLALGLLEAAMVAWMLHHRAVEIRSGAVLHALHLSSGLFATLCGALGLGLLVPLLRRRRARLERFDGPSALLVLLSLAACGDALTIPLSLTAGALVLLTFADSPSTVLRFSPLQGARRGSLVFLISLGLAFLVVRLLGSPPLPYRALLLLGALGAFVLARREQGSLRSELLGWTAALFLGVLSHPAQLPGILALTLLAVWAGRTVAASEPRATAASTVLVATILCVGVRVGLFALFEGAFELSQLELWLAFQGNPAVELVFGTAIVITKFALPWLLAFSFVTSRLGVHLRRQVFAWTVAFWCLRIAQIVCGMTLARGTFYSPYLDSGRLALSLAILVTLPIALALGGAPARA